MGKAEGVWGLEMYFDFVIVAGIVCSHIDLFGVACAWFIGLNVCVWDRYKMMSLFMITFVLNSKTDRQ